MFLVCCAALQSASEKGCTLKGENLLPTGANSLLLEYIPCQKPGKTI